MAAWQEYHVKTIESPRHYLTPSFVMNFHPGPAHKLGEILACRLSSEWRRQFQVFYSADIDGDAFVGLHDKRTKGMEWKFRISRV